MVRSNRSNPGIFGKILLSLFLAVFLGIGALLTHQMALSLLDQYETYSWPELSCQVLSSQVEEHPGAADADESYVFRVHYRWDSDGAAGMSNVYRSSYGGSADIGDTLRLARYYSAGAQVPCWVNPAQADVAVLQLESPWNILMLLFPLIFVAAGGGGILLVWKRAGASASASRLRRSISSRAAGKQLSRGCLPLFFAIFLLAGLGIMVPFFLLPGYQIWNSGHWNELPCTIEYSAVRSHPGEDSTTYSVDVLYSYEVAGTGYKSSRYDFFSGSDSEYASKREFVDRNPPGTIIGCYVDPDEPLNAVLKRDFEGRWAWALIPLIFVIVGGVGMTWPLLAGAGKPRARQATSTYPESWLPSTADQVSFGPRVLRSSRTPLGRLLGAVLTAGFWNGITGIFVWLAVSGLMEGEETGCMTIFLIPFVLIGLLLLANIPYQILASFNPRLEMTVDSPSLVPGKEVGLSWRFEGSAGRIRKLKISLEGTEKVTYRRGTNTHSDAFTFATISLLELEPPSRLDQGQIQFSVPAGSMHSFSASNNQIVWKLKISGEIKVWPDIAEEFEVQVEPCA